jgi:hypothetical protein
MGVNEILPLAIGVALMLGWLMLTVSTLGPPVVRHARAFFGRVPRRPTAALRPGSAPARPEAYGVGRREQFAKEGW